MAWKCPGRGIFFEDGTFQKTVEHNHAPPEISTANRQAFHEDLKKRCMKKESLGQQKKLFEKVAEE